MIAHIIYAKHKRNVSCYFRVEAPDGQTEGKDAKYKPQSVFYPHTPEALP